MKLLKDRLIFKKKNVIQELNDLKKEFRLKNQNEQRNNQLQFLNTGLNSHISENTAEYE